MVFQALFCWGDFEVRGSCPVPRCLIVMVAVMLVGNGDEAADGGVGRG
jgi:hypothetical protein